MASARQDGDTAVVGKALADLTGFELLDLKKLVLFVFLTWNIFVFIDLTFFMFLLFFLL